MVRICTSASPKRFANKPKPAPCLRKDSRYSHFKEHEGIGEEDTGVVQSDDNDHKRQFAGAGAGRRADGIQRTKEQDRHGIVM